MSGITSDTLPDLAAADAALVPLPVAAPRKPATATGKLFLAAASSDDVRAYARRTGLPATTVNSISTLPALEKELERVRRHAIAFDMEEVETGVRCIAAGIRNHRNELLAGLSLSTPAERFDAERASLVLKAANEISRALGCPALP